MFRLPDWILCNIYDVKMCAYISVVSLSGNDTILTRFPFGRNETNAEEKKS